MRQNRTLRIVAVALSLTAAFVIGCKSGGGAGFARKKTNMADRQDGPSLGRTASRDSDVDLAYETRGAARGASRTSEPRGPQLNCPVDGQPLGVSGQPSTVTLKGEPVFVCCPSCAKKAQQNPDKFLAKVRSETARRD